MVRLKSRYLIVSLTFKDGKLFSPSARMKKSGSAGNSSSAPSSVILLEPASEAALLQPLRAALAASAGDVGAAAAGPGGGLSVRAFDPTSGVAVVRCPRSSVAALRVAMATAMPTVADRALLGGGAATLRVCGSAGSARRAAAAAVRSRPLLVPASFSPLPLPRSSAAAAAVGRIGAVELKKGAGAYAEGFTRKNATLRAAVLRVRDEALRRIATLDA